MVNLTDDEKKWVDGFLGNRGGSNTAGTVTPNAGRVYSKVGGTLVDIDDLKGNPNLRPEGPDLQVPKRANLVKLFDLDNGKEYELTADQVRTIKASDSFLDNFEKLEAQPDWMELTVVTIVFILKGGKKFEVRMDDVNHGLNHSAQFYCLKGGITYPSDGNKKPLFDAINTPHIVGGKEWVENQIVRLKQQREEIAWIVYAFAGAVASLGGTAAGAPKIPGSRPTTIPRRGGAPPKAPPRINTGGTGGGNKGGGSSVKTPPPKPAKAFPGRRAPTQEAQIPKPKIDADQHNGAQKASQDMKRSHTDPEGVWHQGAFEGNPNLKSSLDSYAAAKKPGDKGFSVKNLDIVNKNPEKLHQELQAAGFEYHREPLMAFEQHGKKHYRLRQARWEVNGKPVREGTPGAELAKTTIDKNDKDVVPHDIYQHPDGGLVRIKPEGDPNGRRPWPQVSKSVLNDPNAGTGFENEMFKVTNDGQPVPKLPREDWGMKQAPRNSANPSESSGYVDAVMGAAHPDLKY